MRALVKDNQDIQVIRRFVGWAEKTKTALHKGKELPACSSFVLTSFIQKLCSIHRNRMLGNETEETNCCENHNYLYIALRLTYDFHLKLKIRVSMLLREIFLCEGSLKAIFSILPHSHSPIRVTSDVHINTYTLYSKPRCFDSSVLDYFVKSICPLEKDDREKEGLIYNAENILNCAIDACGTTPLMAAMTLADPSLVLLLLRHGADPLLYYRGDEMDFPQKSPVGFAVDALNISVVLKESSWAVRTVAENTKYQNSSEPVNDREEKPLTCLSYFSRAVYALDIRESSQTVDTTTPHEEKFAKGIFYEIHPKLTTAIDLASYRQPPSLRHACRFVIRRTMSSVGKERLPSAIKMLPVPTIVQRYLDLRF